MRGWLHAEAGPASFTFDLDGNGRVIAPIIHCPGVPMDLGAQEKKMALEWSKLWHRIGGSIDLDSALHDLEVAIAGRRIRDIGPDEKRILHAAASLLWRCHHYEATERTKRAFPWIELVSMEGRVNCLRAISLDRKLVSVEHHELLPMPACDVAECHCCWLQRTEGQRVRRGYVERDGDGWRKARAIG